jgi:ATP-binding cassette subfamily B protein
VLQDVNLHIRPGEQAALVESTGAGKSTLVTLPHRVADVTRGRITIDGIDARLSAVNYGPRQDGAP